MIEQVSFNHEKEALIGASTLELAQRIIANNSSIKTIELAPYTYVPNTHSEKNPSPVAMLKERFVKMRQCELDECVNWLGRDWNIGLDSGVLLESGEKSHLLIVDLAPKKSKKSLGLIKKRFKEIIKPQYGGGFFLETGESYHYFGENIISESKWYEWLGDCLLASVTKNMPGETSRTHTVLGDYRYVGHSLKRHYATLRLTTKGDKTFSPRVVDFV
jgi:hypothetical protein